MGVPIFGALARKVFGTRNQRMVNRYLRVVSAVNKLEPSIRALSDAQLLARTAEFRQRISGGEQPIALPAGSLLICQTRSTTLCAWCIHKASRHFAPGLSTCKSLAALC